MLTSLLFLGCAPDTVSLDSTGGVDTLDVTVSEADLGTLGADQLVLDGPVADIEPGQDLMLCVYGTYTGPDVGLHDVHTWQGRYGHHLQLMGTTVPAIDAPDGTIVDCSTGSTDFPMEDLEPIGVTNGGTVDGKPIAISMPLPDGMAVELESGQRYVVQSHYVNTGPDRLHIGDKAVLTTLPADDVVTWAAPLIFNRDDFSVPPGGDLTTSFRCTTDLDWSFVYLLGHMHEWGSAFELDQVDGDVRTPVYSIPEWDPVYRDAPVILDGTQTPLSFPAGTTFETTCSWHNDTDEPLEFPREMCDTISFVYPQKATIICDGDGQ